MRIIRHGLALATAAFLASAGASQAATLDAEGLISSFGTIALGDYTLKSHTEAPVYVGGNFNSDQSITPRGNAQGTVTPSIKGTLVVGGDLAGRPTMNNGTVVTNTLSGTVQGGNNTVTTGASVPVQDVRNAMEGLSKDLAQLTDTGASYDFSDWNQMSLSSGTPVDGSSVLNLSSADFLKTGTLKTFGNLANTFIVNVAGSVINIGANFNQDDSSVIFNFYEATEVNVNSTFGFGILSPLATLNLYAGGTDTFVVGNDVNQYTEVRGTFTGTLPSPVPLPAAGWLLLASIGGVAALRRRRKAS